MIDQLDPKEKYFSSRLNCLWLISWKLSRACMQTHLYLVVFCLLFEQAANVSFVVSQSKLHHNHIIDSCELRCSVRRRWFDLLLSCRSIQLARSSGAAHQEAGHEEVCGYALRRKTRHLLPVAKLDRNMKLTAEGEFPQTILHALCGIIPPAASIYTAWRQTGHWKNSTTPIRLWLLLWRRLWWSEHLS